VERGLPLGSAHHVRIGGVTWRIPAVTSLDALSVDPLQWADDAVLKAVRGRELRESFFAMKLAVLQTGVSAEEAAHSMARLQKVMKFSPRSVAIPSIPPITR
jgi:hypothetical protein